MNPNSSLEPSDSQHWN